MRNEVKIINNTEFKTGDILEFDGGGFNLFIRYTKNKLRAIVVDCTGQTSMMMAENFKLAPGGAKFGFAGKTWIQGESNDGDI